MQSIFINSLNILYPAFFTKYYNAKGETYQRIESVIDAASFDKDMEAVKVELYRNSESEPVMVKVIYR